MPAGLSLSIPFDGTSSLKLRHVCNPSFFLSSFLFFFSSFSNLPESFLPLVNIWEKLNQFRDSIS